MRRLSQLSFILVAGLACGQAHAQAPSPTTPPDKIDPEPVQPAKPSPPAAAAAADATDAKAATGDQLGVAANVSAARVAGPWEAEGKKGFSRVVGVIDGGRQRFFVQWLEEPAGAVVETKELEDEEAAKLTFGDVRAETSDTGVTVFMDTIPDQDGLRDTWVLIIGEPGETRFGPATN